MKFSPLTLCLLFLSLISAYAQPGIDFGDLFQSKIKYLNEEINKYPDSLELREQRVELVLRGTYYINEDGMEDIDFLLDKKPNFPHYLLQKAYLLYNPEKGIENTIPYFENYLKYETDAGKIRNALMYIGKLLHSEKKYPKALQYYDKALLVLPENQGMYRNSDILKRKKEAYHALKQYKNAYEMMTQIYGADSIWSIRYNNEYVKDYAKSRQNIYEHLEKLYPKCKTKNGFQFYDTDNFQLSKYIRELAYSEFQMGNEEKSLRILFDFICYDYRGIFIISNEIYEPHWCMFESLRKKHKDDYRIHLVCAYFFTKEAHDLVNLDFALKKAECRPLDIADLEFLSWNDMQQKICGVALKEIKQAEHLSGKEFDLYRAITLREMGKKNQSIQILGKLARKHPDSLSINYALALSHLSRSKNQSGPDYRKYKKYREKAFDFNHASEGFFLPTE